MWFPELHGENRNREGRGGVFEEFHLMHSGANTRVPKDSDAGSRRDDVLEIPEPFGDQIRMRIRQTCDVPAGPGQVIPMMMQHYMMLRRNLLYTGITRGKKMVVLVGQKQAIGMAVKGRIESRRWSKLEEWLSVPN